jgi:hypothetical protein
MAPTKIAKSTSFLVPREATATGDVAAEAFTRFDRGMPPDEVVTELVFGEIARNDGPRELLQRSSSIRGLVVHALAVPSALQGEAGRLDAIASLPDAEALGDTDAT